MHRNDPAPERLMTPLDPGQLGVLRVRAVLMAMFPLVLAASIDFGALRETPVPPRLVTAVVAALALAAVLVLPPRRYRSWSYHEGADELDIRHGLLFRVRTVVPFGRVQHIDVSQGPVERRYGVATLILHTAGTRGAAVSLPGLEHAEAERMRERIRAKIRQDLT
jgi:uncharacterized protein